MARHSLSNIRPAARLVLCLWHGRLYRPANRMAIDCARDWTRFRRDTRLHVGLLAERQLLSVLAEHVFGQWEVYHESDD
jgi:hypothetical protein